LTQTGTELTGGRNIPAARATLARPGEAVLTNTPRPGETLAQVAARSAARTGRPTDPKARKNAPIARGVLYYFPDAMFEIAELSKIGNDQHNPGQEMHWAKDKSSDHADCIVRHLIDAGTRDTDGVRHATKVAWRSLALLQTEIDKELGVQ
jgi:hypothetical protein